MKIAIRYFTKSKKGNTKKLADAVSEALQLKALTIENPLEEQIDLLFFVNAMYAFNVDKEVRKYLKDNADKIKVLININSAASGSSTLNSIKKATKDTSIEVSEKEFHCVGSWLALNKGRPNEDDLNKLKQFVKEVRDSYLK